MKACLGWLAVSLLVGTIAAETGSGPWKTINLRPLGVTSKDEVKAKFIDDDHIVLNWHSRERHISHPENLVVLDIAGNVETSEHFDGVMDVETLIGASDSYVLVAREKETLVLDGMLKQLAAVPYEGSDGNNFLRVSSSGNLVGSMDLSKGLGKERYFVFSGAKQEAVSVEPGHSSLAVSDFGWIFCDQAGPFSGGCGSFTINGTTWKFADLPAAGERPRGLDAQDLTFLSPKEAVWLDYEDRNLHDVKSDGTTSVVVRLKDMLPGGDDFQVVQTAAHASGRVFIWVAGCYIGGREICWGRYGRIFVVDIPTRTLLFVRDVSLDEYAQAAISPSGHLVSLQRKGTLRIYQVS